jgi:tetratricopeptide (TPR) repeat protein
MTIKSAFTLHTAQHLAKTGRMAEAVQSLKKACGLIADPRLAIQKALLTGEKEDREALRRIHPQSGAALLTASILSYGAGEFENAIGAATDGLCARPGDPSLKTVILLARSRSGQDVDIHHLRECAKNAILGVRACALTEVERRMIQSRPDDNGAIEKEDTLGGPFGFLLDRLDDLASVMGFALYHSINLVRHVVDAKKRAVYSLITQGDRLWAMRRRDEAAKRFEEALQVDPNCVEALESLVRHYLDKGDVAKAVACFSSLEKTVASEAETAPTHILRISADLAFFTRNHKKAHSLYSRIIESAPHDYVAPYRRGLCLLRMGDEKGAVESFRMALGIPNPRLMEDRFDALEAACKR